MTSHARFVISYADALTVLFAGTWGLGCPWAGCNLAILTSHSWVALSPPSPISLARIDLLPKREKEAALKDRGQLRIAFFVCLLMIKEGIAS